MRENETKGEGRWRGEKERVGRQLEYITKHLKMSEYKTQTVDSDRQII